MVEENVFILETAAQSDSLIEITFVILCMPSVNFRVAYVQIFGGSHEEITPHDFTDEYRNSGGRSISGWRRCQRRREYGQQR